MDISELKAPEVAMEMAAELRVDGITEEAFRKFIDQKLPDWRKCEDFRKRMEALFDILFHTSFQTDDDVLWEKTSLKVIAKRIKDLAKENKIDVLDANVLLFYQDKYGNFTSNELVDFLSAVYGFKGLLPVPNPQKKEYFLNLLKSETI